MSETYAGLTETLWHFQRNLHWSDGLCMDRDMHPRARAIQYSKRTWNSWLGSRHNLETKKDPSPNWLRRCIFITRQRGCCEMNTEMQKRRKGNYGQANHEDLRASLSTYNLCSKEFPLRDHFLNDGKGTKLTSGLIHNFALSIEQWNLTRTQINFNKQISKHYMLI